MINHTPKTQSSAEQQTSTTHQNREQHKTMINHAPKHRTMIKNHSPSTQGSSAVVQSNYMGTSQNHSVTRCTATLEDSVIFSTQSFISSSVSTRISKGGPWWRVMMRKAYLSPRGCSGSGNNKTTSTLQHFCSDFSPRGCKGSGNSNTISTLQHFCSDFSPRGCKGSGNSNTTSTLQHFLFKSEKEDNWLSNSHISPQHPFRSTEYSSNDRIIQTYCQ